jgi:nitrite reductase/ring-hydroxylating ferredoxin subunit
MEQSLEGYLPTVKVDELQLNRPKRVKTENGFAVVVKTMGDAGEYLAAFTPICPHAMGDMSYGMVYKGEVECPVHGYRFDVQTGACTMPGDESPLAIFPVQVVDGVVHVKVTRPKWMQG